MTAPSRGVIGCLREVRHRTDERVSFSSTNTLIFELLSRAVSADQHRDRLRTRFVLESVRARHSAPATRQSNARGRNFSMRRSELVKRKMIFFLEPRERVHPELRRNKSRRR